MPQNPQQIVVTMSSPVISNGVVDYDYSVSPSSAAGSGAGGVKIQGPSVITYQLDASVNDSWIFLGATISEKDSGVAVNDVTTTISKDGRFLVATNTDVDNGKICFVFNMQNGTTRISTPDPEEDNTTNN